MGLDPRWKVAATVGGVIVSAVGLYMRSRENDPKPPQRVALIGDSYAVGLGPQLQKLIPEFRYEGHVGSNTWQWAHQYAPKCGQCGDWLANYHPDIVLVSLGVNDGAHPERSNYQTIVREIHGSGAQVVWIQPPTNVQTPSRAVIASLGVRTAPAPTIPLSPDGLHPASYEQWARQIAEAL